MHGLEEQLVAVRPLLRGLLQREQLVGSQVALVVAGALAGEDGLAEVLDLAGGHGGSILLGVSDLFADSARAQIEESAPLALRLRPRSLDQFVGQEQVLGEGSALRLAIAEDRVGSSILFGPPGTGKTTLARIVAETTGAAFEELSAVSATVKDVREVLARARERLGGSGQRTILFLDEIHRFNKAQQDALLPAVEEGLVTLIGATTENPYFEVNSALLSRSRSTSCSRSPRTSSRSSSAAAPRRSMSRSATSSSLSSRGGPAATRATRSTSSSSPRRRRGPRAAR